VPFNIEAVPRVINVTLEKEMQAFMTTVIHVKENLTPTSESQ
jgi:hypothetical protein